MDNCLFRVRVKDGNYRAINLQQDIEVKGKNKQDLVKQIREVMGDNGYIRVRRKNIYYSKANLRKKQMDIKN